ncbi:MAG: Vms1/Ankzf1 family peptidyl-tRNA hydrolase [Deferrisomatales bacterium]|nr:Vms1/Ankzf1 family peptidyl-tRNA hydrolase [Deferrisomatales bacterium]
MPLLEDLKRLARLPRTTSPFFTLYLNTRWDGEKQRERVRIFVKTRLKECLAEAAKRDGVQPPAVQDDADKVSHYVRGLVNREWDEDYAGIAVFACAALGVYRVVRSHLPFSDYLGCSDRPLLRPAAEHAHTGKGGLVALVAADAGQVLEFELGSVCKQFSFRDEEFPGRHDQGGWSQGRYQRHVDEHLHRNLKRLAEHLVRWADEGGAETVLLSGQDALLSAFEQHLPKRILARVGTPLHLDPTASAAAILAHALDAVAGVRAARDRAAVDDLLDRSAGPGRAVVGPTAVADAVASGKVHQLYLDEGFRDMGWKCFGCGALGVKVPLGCPGCGAPAEGVDLGEELVRGTLATDGTVVAVAGVDGLQREGGVGARLRY